MSLILRLAVSALFLPGLVLAGISDVPEFMSMNHTEYFSEDWESGVGLWNSSNGVWEVGGPSYGTSECFGSNCAATDLNGTYPQGTYSRLESVIIDLPESTADDVLWLGFWHYFSSSTYYGTDYCSVLIWTEESGWVEKSHHFVRSSQVWAPFYLDISEYVGQSIKLGFLYNDEETHSSSGEGPGWYVDQIKIFDGDFIEPVQINSFDQIADMDWDGWYPDQGVWERGEPQSGISNAYSGRFCFGTNLAGNYPYNVNSRLISPHINLKSTPLDGQLYFSFKQFSSLSNYYGTDKAILQINDGSGWVTLDSINWHDNLGSNWVERSYEISEYAGQKVRFGFVIDDNPTHSSSGSGAGWYIDDLQFSEGAKYVGNPEKFENYAPNWHSTSGLWEIGEPSSGPSSAYSGTRCWGTDLNGSYQQGAYDRLYTPAIPLDNTSGLYLVFQHWYSFSNYYGTDYGVVSIKTEDGEWTSISSNFVGSSSDWTQFSYDLSAYAGQTVQFSFLMVDVQTHSSSGEGAGWYIDDFKIVGMPESDPPADPFTLSVSFSPGPVELTFYHVLEDVEKVIIYGSPVDDFKPTIGTRLAVLPPSAMSWSDTDRPGWPANYYRVSVVDNMGNESVPILATSISAVPEQNQGPSVDLLKVLGAVPNPFNPITFIKFSLPAAGMVDVEVYDISGRKIASLLHKSLEAGSHKVPFAPTNLASGTYFARVTAGGESQSSKMVLLK